MLVVCLLFGQGAIVPEVAAAFTIPELLSGWAESSVPCNVAEGAVFPQPILWREVGESVPAPDGYFTYGVPQSSEALPASDFTATVSWEGGITAPARVESAKAGDDECYTVSAPDHIYANAGTYPFSYTIHELKTGLDHRLAALDYPELHIYSKIPQLVGGPSSRVIDAAVGAPWSGVVAEFNYADLSGYTGLLNASSDPYSALIEWGDGEAPTTGTISTRGSEPAFTVSGSHTYTRPLTGTIRVLLSIRWGNKTEALGAWATGSVDATPPLRFDGQPLLAAIPRGTRAPLYELIFRLNRALPRTSAGHVDAMIEANGHTSPVRRLTAHGTSACYIATASTTAKRKLKPGAHYPFTLVVDGASDTRDKAYGLVRSLANINRIHSAASQLGCA